MQILMTDDFTEEEIKNMPRFKMGKYKGKRVDKVPLHYLRFVLRSKFEPEIMAAAKKRYEYSNITSDIDIAITRHAYDRFSLRFTEEWRGKDIGFGSFVVIKAHDALKYGIEGRKGDYDDTVVKIYEGIRYIFNKEKNTLITVM